MANEILKRNPTSTGNRRVFTWAGWVKINQPSSATNCIWYVASAGNSEFNISIGSGAINVYDYAPGGYQYQYITSRLLRDFSNWFHLVVAVDTTQFREDDRFKIYINGVLYNGIYSTEVTVGGINYNTRMNTPGEINYIGQNVVGGSTYSANCELTDLFMIDGQALTADVFGFNKVGKGYISVGSTQSTDFRPGQWVPKTPRVIKTAINNNGGFGVNGFYLPMNDSNNFGADFHGTPNSIIKLQENLPQPRCRIDGVGDYTGALRADPFKQYLVLALPFVSGGLSSGFGDYSAAIKGSGSAKTITNNSSVSIGNTASYYGSAAQFNGSNYLTIPTNTDFDFGTGDFTIEYWANYQTLSPALSDTIMGGTSTGCFGVYMSTSQWGFVSQNQAALQLSSGTTVGTNQFNHFAVVRKGNTLTGYLNGVAGAASTTWTYNMTNTGLGIGAQNNGNNKITAYLQDLRIYKGVAKYTGGFDVPRPYTPVGIATWRAVPDTTANNFATWNPTYPVIAGSNAAYTNGNLTIAEPTGNTSQGTATIGVSTGKWYYEAFPSNVTTGSHMIGIRPAEWFTSNPQNRTIYRSDGTTYDDAGTTVQSGTTYTSSDIIGVAFNMNTKQLWFSKNGSWVYSGNPSGGSNQAVSFASTYTHYTPVFCFDNVAGTQTWDTNFGQNPSFSGNTTAGTFTDTNGKGLFKYQPPSGFLALCEDNLPTPAIANPGKHFKTVLWTGSSSTRSIVGVGFTPDLVWIKSRSTAGSSASNNLYDSVRPTGFLLSTNETSAELSYSSSGLGLSGMNSDGFSIIGAGSLSNESPNNYVAWCWRAGAGTTSTNTNGSITSVVSVNQDAGFSIVSWTGAGTNTVGHGLGKVPAFIIMKARNEGTASWAVYHKSIGPTQWLQLNSTSASVSSAGIWNNTTPTSSVFTIGSGWGTYNYINYCWAEIEGFSKAFSYVGNGSADGPMIYLGLKPALIIIKRTDNVGNWQIYDSSRMSTNPNNGVLFPNLSNIEGVGSAYDIDFLSNGFKLRSTDTDRNASGSTYVGFAWAESPFTTSNSK